jgi:hypothetical protein
LSAWYAKNKIRGEKQEKFPEHEKKRGKAGGKKTRMAAAMFSLFFFSLSAYWQ